MTSSEFDPRHLARDPALLAVVKCHLTSFLRWEVLRLLATQPDEWSTAAELAEALRASADVVSATLEELVRERMLQRCSDSNEPAYRLEAGDPSGRVIARLVDTAKRDQVLRQCIVARIVSTAEGRGPAASAAAAHAPRASASAHR